MGYLYDGVGSCFEWVELIVSIIVGEVEYFNVFLTGSVIIGIYTYFPSCHTFFSWISHSVLIGIIIDISGYITSVGLWSFYKGECSRSISFLVTELIYSIVVKGVCTDYTVVLYIYITWSTLILIFMKWALYCLERNIFSSYMKQL